MKFKKGSKLLYTAGIPLFCFVVGGSYVLSQFLQTNLEIKDKRQNTTISTRKFNLEEEHKNLMKNLDIDNFSLSRIPRPEENTKPESKDETKQKSSVNVEKINKIENQ